LLLKGVELARRLRATGGVAVLPSRTLALMMQTRTTGSLGGWHELSGAAIAVVESDSLS